MVATTCGNVFDFISLEKGLKCVCVCVLVCQRMRWLGEGDVEKCEERITNTHFVLAAFARRARQSL